MTEIVFQVDRTLETAMLQRALAHAFSVDASKVSLITDEQMEMGRPWLPVWAAVGAKTSSWRGDFPLEVDIALRQQAPNIRSVLHTVAHDTDALLLTDQLEASAPSGTVWLMISPDGIEHIVHGEPEAFADEDDPGIVLLPEFRHLLRSPRLAGSGAR
jgi:hypothetical protein